MSQNWNMTSLSCVRTRSTRWFALRIWLGKIFLCKEFKSYATGRWRGEWRSPCCGYLVIWAFGVKTMADQAAKNIRPLEFIPIPYTDWIPNTKRRMYELWEESWKEGRRNFYLSKPKTGYWSEDTRKKKERRLSSDQQALSWSCTT